MEEHYASWLETMLSQFGHKWLCLHRGPVWQYEVEPQVGVYTYEVDWSNVDIIQSALEQSSLSLEESSDSLMDGESVAVPFCSSPSLEENVHEENLHHADGVEDVVHVSHLWNRVPESARQEMEQGLVSPQEMEKLHSIQPNSSTTSRRNPYMYDPLKVGDVKQLYYNLQCAVKCKCDNLWLVNFLWCII